MNMQSTASQMSSQSSTASSDGKSIELEELRQKALSSDGSIGNLDEAISRLTEMTSRIHAAFLFHSPRTLQPLLRALNDVNWGAAESGWQMLGDKLGLDVGVLKVINNNAFNHEDPIYNTLLHYVQYEDATLEKIVQAVVEMGRLDVIMRTKDDLFQLANLILNHERDLLRSSRLRSGLNSSDVEVQPELPVNSECLIKPSVVPDAPFIMRNVQAAPLLSTLLLENVASRRTNVICASSFSSALAIEPPPGGYEITSQIMLRASPVQKSFPLSPSIVIDTSTEPAPVPATKQVYARKVLLTFASDGAEMAAEVARKLRQPRGSQRIGVLILDEQHQHVQPDPHLFIAASVQMVDYIIPILTQGYLRTVVRRAPHATHDLDTLDTKHVAFIYQTIMQDYSRRGCVNAKVRSLIPDEQVNAVVDQLMMASPIFSAWERISRLDSIIDRMLASAA